MAVICIPDQSPVKLSRWAFRLLLEPAATEVADHRGDRQERPEPGTDEFVLRQAMALDGLHFDLLAEEDRGQAVRIAQIVARQAAGLRLELRRHPRDQRDLEFAEILDTLAMHLDGYWMTESAKPQDLTKIVVQAPAAGSFPLWTPGPPEVDLDPSVLPVSSELVADLLTWASDYDATADPEHSAVLQGGPLDQHGGFLERGHLLARRLSKELGSHYRVTYQGDGCRPEQEMLPVSYFAILVDPAHPRGRTAGLVRRVHTEPVPTDEAVHRDLQWHPSEYLRRYHLGDVDGDHVEITEAEAEAAIAYWREHGLAWRPGD